MYSLFIKNELTLKFTLCDQPGPRSLDPRRKSGIRDPSTIGLVACATLPSP
jgi:hypothetical protein